MALLITRPHPVTGEPRQYYCKPLGPSFEISRGGFAPLTSFFGFWESEDTSLPRVDVLDLELTATVFIGADEDGNEVSAQRAAYQMLLNYDPVEPIARDVAQAMDAIEQADAALAEANRRMRHALEEAGDSELPPMLRDAREAAIREVNEQRDQAQAGYDVLAARYEAAVALRDAIRNAEEV